MLEMWYLNVRIPDLCNAHQPIDFREVLQAFTLDVIGKCAYNVEFGALQEDKLHKPKILNDLQGYIDSQNVVPDAFTSAMYLMILAEPKLSIWLEAYPKVTGTLRHSFLTQKLFFYFPSFAGNVWM